MHLNSQVETVSIYLQKYMALNNIKQLTADACADILAKTGILSNKIGPKPGFNFRQMLRDGRDGYIHMVSGATQKKPKARWAIKLL